MEIKKEVKNNQLFVTVKGQIDTGTCGEFETAILEQKLGVDIVCDFKDVTYVSSAGLRVILTIDKSQKELSKKFVLINVPNDVLEVFKMTGFAEFLEIK